MNASRWLAAATGRLSRKGFNLIGVASRERSDAAAPPGHRLADTFPGARSAVVIGAGGRGLWEKLAGRRDAGPAPDSLAPPIATSGLFGEPFPGAGPDPIDHHTRSVLSIGGHAKVQTHLEAAWTPGSLIGDSGRGIELPDPEPGESGIDPAGRVAPAPG